MMFFPSSKTYRYDNFCVVDLETTGLSPKKCEIIEVGILKIRKGKPAEKMEVFIRPKTLPLPVFITNLTGITTEMLAEAPSIEEVDYWIWDFIGDDPILGYNVLFDLGFLRAHTRKHTRVQNVFLDVLPLARICWPELSSHSLSTMTSHLNLYQNTHRALDDVIATWQLYVLCLDHLKGLSDQEIAARIAQDRERRKELWKQRKESRKSEQADRPDSGFLD